MDVADLGRKPRKYIRAHGKRWICIRKRSSTPKDCKSEAGVCERCLRRWCSLRGAEVPPRVDRRRERM